MVQCRGSDVDLPSKPRRCSAIAEQKQGPGTARPAHGGQGWHVAEVDALNSTSPAGKVVVWNGASAYVAPVDGCSAAADMVVQRRRRARVVGPSAWQRHFAAQLCTIFAHAMLWAFAILTNSHLSVVTPPG
jgi:hypothetical protein